LNGLLQMSFTYFFLLLCKLNLSQLLECKNITDLFSTCRLNYKLFLALEAISLTLLKKWFVYWQMKIHPTGIPLTGLKGRFWSDGLRKYAKFLNLVEYDKVKNTCNFIFVPNSCSCSGKMLQSWQVEGLISVMAAMLVGWWSLLMACRVFAICHIHNLQTCTHLKDHYWIFLKIQHLSYIESIIV
jgi:hypothetical protein